MYRNEAQPEATISAYDLARANEALTQWFWIKRGLIVALIVTAALLGGCPQYRIYSATATGRAKLAEAENARRVQVAQAQGEKEAAQLRAAAIAIVGKAAQEFPEYRRQEFIGAFAEALKEGKISQIMYIPTEAGMPITEAHRAAQTEARDNP